MQEFLRDLRFGIRNLRKARGFAAIAIGSLALGIGGSTAMYSVIYGVILDPFPYRDPDRLMSVAMQGERGGNGSYYAIDDFLDIAERNTVFQGVVASTVSDVTWTGEGDPQRLRGNHCTFNTFDIMGVPPLIGRAAQASDADAEAVTVLGYKFWQRQFAGDPSVLGRKLTLNGKARTVIGVMPPRFMWRGADVYLPDVFHRGQPVDDVTNVHLLGRLKPGVTREQATAALGPLFEDLRARKPDLFPKQWSLRLYTFGEAFPSGIRDTLWILFGAVGLLLVIACVNVSNLLLSRAAYRRREIAIRAAMGAGRFRVIRQLLAESLLLAIAGCAAGVVLAYAGLAGIIAMVPPNTIPDEAKIAMNLPVLLFSLGVSAVAAVVFGLAPALHLSGRDILTPLKESGRGVSGGAGQKVMRGILVVAEVALSLMLLVGASLMVRTLLSVQAMSPGFHPERIQTLRIPFSGQRYSEAARRNQFVKDLIERAGSLPGVQAVSVNLGLPPVYGMTLPVQPPGAAQPDSRPVVIQNTDASWAKVMGLELLQGRFLTAQETGARTQSAVVNQSFVQRYFPSGDVLGRMVRLPRLRTAPFSLPDDAFQIVGVTRDAVNRAASNETWPEMIIPYTVTGRSDRLYVLTAGEPAALNRAIKAQVYAVDPVQPVTEDKPLEAALGEFVYSRPRFNLLLFGVFAGLGMMLALFGIYGVISHAVAQQRREIGIRIALGAGFGQVTGMVLKMGAKLLAIGLAVGLAGSLASVKVLRNLVANVSPFDPYSFAAVVALLFAAGLFASFWPARRAARVDPLTVLRDE